MDILREQIIYFKKICQYNDKSIEEMTLKTIKENKNFVDYPNITSCFYEISINSLNKLVKSIESRKGDSNSLHKILSFYRELHTGSNTSIYKDILIYIFVNNLLDKCVKSSLP